MSVGGLTKYRSYSVHEERSVGDPVEQGAECLDFGIQGFSCSVGVPVVEVVRHVVLAAFYCFGHRDELLETCAFDFLVP